jgi:drug/metabolite transporter (DMT)-like permease
VYFSVVFAAAYGWLFWGERITWTTVSGTLLVGVAGLLAARAAPAAGLRAQAA